MKLAHIYFLKSDVFTSGQNSPSTFGSYFPGLDSPEIGGAVNGSTGSLYADVAGSPESPINTFPTVFDVNVKKIDSKSVSSIRREMIPNDILTTVLLCDLPCL